MSHETEQFDDPALKQALRRAHAGQIAPEALRQRVAALVSQSGGAAEAKPRVLSLHQRQTWRIAAALLLAMVGLYAIIAIRNPKAQVPQALLVGMADRHDGCCKEPTHRHPGLPQEDMKLLGRAMSQKLQVQVLAADLGSDGWRFNGGALCPINGHPTGHLVFFSGGSRLSVFSIPPAGAQGAADGAIGLFDVPAHRLAAFVDHGAVYALVNDGVPTLTDAELSRLLLHHRGDIVNAAIALKVVPPPAGLQ